MAGSGASDERSEYCASHRRYFKAGGGCELCTYEQEGQARRSVNAPRLQRCPVCGEVSLLWYQCRNHGECMNLDCKLADAEKDY